MNRDAWTKELLAGCVLVIMAVTNPSMDAFRSHIADQLVREARATGRGALVDVAAGLKQNLGVDAPRWLADRITSDVTRQNFIFVSTYEGQAGSWIGLLGFFWKYR